jgi:hypothetical protein
MDDDNMTSSMTHAAIYYNSTSSAMAALQRVAAAAGVIDDDEDAAAATANSDYWIDGFPANATPAPPHWQTAVLGLLAAGTSLVTIGGNLIVILSFVLERTIRQPSNYFIASLAVSDLLIGTRRQKTDRLPLVRSERASERRRQRVRFVL